MASKQWMSFLFGNEDSDVSDPYYPPENAWTTLEDAFEDGLIYWSFFD